MIPQSHIMEWSQKVPWHNNEQVEQDLIICRALVEIFSDDWLAERLAFRGGTALHKLYLDPQPRYSEDIDLVQIKAAPFGPIADRIREKLVFLGEPKRKIKLNNFTLYYRYQSEFPPVSKMRLKIETNTREHFSVLGFKKTPLDVVSSWYKGKSLLTTYSLEELLGTKLRALYQRSKGRDLFDINVALEKCTDLDTNALLHCFREYMKFSVENPPTRKEYLLNLQEKMNDKDFLGDTTALLRPDITYRPKQAYKMIKKSLIDHI